MLARPHRQNVPIARGLTSLPPLSSLPRRLAAPPPSLIVAVLLFALFAVPRGALAQRSDDLPGVDGNQYESPTYGYSLEWNDRDWEVVDAASDDNGDELVLTNGDSTLYVEGVAEYDGDADACNIDVSEQVATTRGARDYPPEDGSRSRDAEDYSYLVDCRDLVEGEAVLLIVHVFPQDDLSAQVEAVQEVTDTVEIPESDSGNSGEDDLAASGVDGNAYESPTYGYSLEWDEDVWEVDHASSDRGIDVINLLDDESSLIISGFGGFSDVSDCMDTAIDFYSTNDRVSDWQPFEDENGDPIARERRTVSYAAFVYTDTDENGDEATLVNYIECRDLGDGSFLLISQLTTERNYDTEAEARDELLDTLVLPDDSNDKDTAPTPFPVKS